MVEIVLGVAVFVLTAAIIGLYAMMGELASRVPDSDRPAGDARLLRPVAGARLGVEPAEWPSELAAVRDADLAHVLVFGSTCVTCRRIASGDTGPLSILPAPLAVVVSCPRPDAGAEFVAEHPMVTDHPYLIDVGGAWVTDNFEVAVSPSVLVFAGGRLKSAHTFTTATTLLQLPRADGNDATELRVDATG
jgi:hypothetical protein